MQRIAISWPDDDNVDDAWILNISEPAGTSRMVIVGEHPSDWLHKVLTTLQPDIALHGLLSFKDWDWHCGDGCCTDYGTILTIAARDGRPEIRYEISSVAMSEVLRAVIKGLGIDAEIDASALPFTQGAPEPLDAPLQHSA